MPSRTNGSEHHRSRSGERGRRDQGHGSERCHESSRFHHATRHRESGERARPTSSSGGSSSRSKQADSMDVPGYDGASGRVTDVRPSTSTHHQHHHSCCPLHLGHRLVVPRLKLRRQRLPSGLPGPVTRRRPFHPASLWWEDPGLTTAQCLPGSMDLNAIDYAVVFGADEVHGSERLHDSPRSRHSPRRRRCGERTRPTSSGGSSSRARHADPTDVQGSGRALGRATEVRPSSSATHHQRHHSRSSADRRPGPDPSFMTTMSAANNVGSMTVAMNVADICLTLSVNHGYPRIGTRMKKPSPRNSREKPLQHPKSCRKRWMTVLKSTLLKKPWDHKIRRVRRRTDHYTTSRNPSPTSKPQRAVLAEFSRRLYARRGPIWHIQD